MRISAWLVILTMAAIVSASIPALEAQGQVLPRPVIRRGLVPPAAAPAPATSEPDAAAGEAKDEGTIDVPRTPFVPLGPKHIRLHLLDGSVISGDLSVSEIEVETPFGKLVVPIDRIRSFQPGLDSYPKLSGEIETHIKNLGSDDYKTREQAHKDLAAMGMKARKELERYVNDENAEIKRHVAEILKGLEAQSEEQADDEDATVEQPWIRLDTVVTTDFTVVGKVSPQEFKIDSKYGPLTIQLADVRQGERETAVRETLRRNVTVEGANLAQRTFKSSGIRVQAGDKIVLKAEGNIIMSPWGSNAATGPDGAPNYGWYIPNQIPGGALVARIGDKGPIFKVGRQLNFTAKTSGVLQFAIGVQAEYANEGYAYPGQYQVKLRIEPK
jgi:hypothetical protein